MHRNIFQPLFALAVHTGCCKIIGLLSEEFQDILDSVQDFTYFRDVSNTHPIISKTPCIVISGSLF